jgi:protein involved in polysaccharide export with SLBB domain
VVINWISKRRFYYFSIGIFYLFFLHSFIYAQTPTPTPENSSPITESTQTEIAPPAIPETPAENLIHMGDLIDVDVVGSSEYDWRGSLNPEGFLNGLNFVEEPIYALCRAEESVAADVAKGFSKILKEPQVIVKIIDRSRRPVSLLYGAIRIPQRFQIQRPVRLNELLILSGGITEKASGEIQILRPPNLSCEAKREVLEKQTAGEVERMEKFISAKQNSESQFINVKISDLIKGQKDANPFIFSGDVVTVLEAEPIYVIGGVANPKQINAHSQTTLSRAIAAAGGFVKGADTKNITIFRREKGEIKNIEVNFEKIKLSEEGDIILRAFDIVEVPQTGRGKSKLAPVINVENKSEKSANLPLRIID